MNYEHIWAEHQRLVTTVVGFAAAAVLMAVLFLTVGVGRIGHVLRNARPTVVFVPVVVCTWLVVWSLAFRTILATLGVRLSIFRSVLVFAGSVFANNVTPFGQAGGEPVTAWLLKGASEAGYESGFAAITTFDAVNLIAGFGLSIVGLGFFALGLSGHEALARETAVAGVIVVVAVPTGMYLLWRYRYALESRFVSGIEPALGRLDRTVARLSVPNVDTVEEGIDGFLADVERVGSDRRAVTTTLALTVAGWLLHAVALWLSIRSIGASASILLLFFVVPFSNVGDLLPLPGGLGGTETILVGLLVSIGLDPPSAAGAVLLYRGLVYWTPTIIGGTVMARVGVGSLL